MSNLILSYSIDHAGQADFSALQLFQDGKNSDAQEVLNACPTLILKAGEALIECGQPNFLLYILLKGKLMTLSESGQALEVIEAGGCAGQLAFADQGPSNVRVVAEEESCVLVLDEDRFWKLVDVSHTIARRFLLDLLQSLRQKDLGRVDQNLQDKYQRLTSVDALTGLYNRRWLSVALERQIMRCSMDKSALSILFIEVDQYEAFVDQYGTSAGEQALYSVAQVMMKNARPVDVLARYDAHQFVLVLPEADVDAAKTLAERLCAVVNEAGVVIPKECILPPVSVSIGLAQLKAFISADKLLAEAKAALDRAKTSGGNQAAA